MDYENNYETEKATERKPGRNVEKGSQKKPVRRQETGKGDKKALFAAIAFVGAFVIFILLVAMQKKIINDVDRTTVVVAVTDIPAGVILTEQNISSYMDMVERPTADIPAGYFTSGYPLVGKVTGRAIAANEIITSSGISGSNLYDDVEDPVEMAIDLAKKNLEKCYFLW